MKTNHAKLSTRLFNFKLFLEGLKRLRVIGLASAILALTASALVPTAMWIEVGSLYSGHTYEMSTEFLCLPAGCMVLLAPFFFFVLFSFLQNRKESDFFHAIPYTRTCVYVSFTAAALTFVFAIQIACGMVAGLLWACLPSLTFDLGGLCAYVLISMLAAAMLSAFMMLALTVSGTSGSCMLLFILFTAFTRVVAIIFLGCLDSIDLLPINDLFNHSILSPCWFLPVSVFVYWGDPQMAEDNMYSLSNILYSLVVTLLLYALAGLFYRYRKSEMAGNPAPGTRAQALFRILFTTLLALLVPMLIIMDNGIDGSIWLILIVGILLVYFLYELITTKRPKNMLKCIPGLGIVAAACVVFALGFYAYRAVVVYEEIQVDDIKSVSMESNGFDSLSYQAVLTESIRTDDPVILGIVADSFAYSQEAEIGSPYDRADDYWQREIVTIRTKSGRVLKRNIIIRSEDSLRILERYMELESVKSVLYELPTADEVNNGNLVLKLSGEETVYTHLYNDDYLTQLVEVFRAEFATLTEEQKREVMAPTFYPYDWTEYDTGFTLGLRGHVGKQSDYFYSEYIITEALPKTRAYFLCCWCLMNSNYYSTGQETWCDSVDAMTDMMLEHLADPDFAAIHNRLGVTLAAVSTLGEDRFIRTVYADAEQLAALLTLLKSNRVLTDGTDPSALSLTEQTYALRLNVLDSNSWTYLEAELHLLVDLTDDDLLTIADVLGTSVPID